MIRKIGIGFLFILLINLIMALALSCNLKNMIVNGIVMETITEKIEKLNFNDSNEVTVDEELTKALEDERVKELLKSKEIQDLVNKYIDITINSIAEDEDLSNVEIEKDILDYIDNHKDVLEEVMGKEVTEEVINETKQQLEGKDISKVFKQNIDNTKKSLSPTEIKVVKGYKIIISNKFKWIVSGLIVLTLLLIALLQKSFYQWIDTLGKAMTVSGILIFVTSIAVKEIVIKASKMSRFQMNSTLITGIGITLVGLIIIVVYKIVEVYKKNKKNEI